ncbi:MAG: PASTA domain-containing protein, partial [Candidatus Hydrogenedentes bacterium]|nr:PASTA domain-containing protein [Candidatus Hydrogenedentota bacterium]
EYSESLPAGHVVSQNPVPGTVLHHGDAVAFVISRGTQFRSVPDLAGMTQADVESALASAELTTGTVTMEYNRTVTAGCVIEQDPAAGTRVVVGSHVAMKVSLGPKPVHVPDVTGLMRPDAESAIIAAELLVGEVREVYMPDRPVGEVLEQRPAGGRDAFAGDPVDLDVASDAIVIYSIEELQQIGDDPAYPMDAPYALGKDLDASVTATWNNGTGFIPIGWQTSDYDWVPFRGSFDGRGHTISGLTTGGTLYGGLFMVIFYDGSVSDLHLTATSLTAPAGAGPIALINLGIISKCTVEGTLTVDSDAGGIVAANYDGAINECVFEGRIQGDVYYGGGICGGNEGGQISQCRFSGNIQGRRAGGITVENDYGYVTDCTAEGTVEGTYGAGGIVAENGGTVADCRSKCEVVGGYDGAGGVVGQNWGELYNSGNLGPVYSSSGYAYVGGLAGWNAGSVESCGNVGPVFGGYGPCGGLLGRNEGLVYDTFSTGPVSGLDRCGGLVGENVGNLQRGYSVGRVKSAGVVGGLVAENAGGVTGCFWCIETSGQTESAAGTGLSIEELLDSDTFEAAGWDYASADGWPDWSQTDGLTVPHLTGSEDAETSYPLEISAVNGTVEAVPAEDQYLAWTLVRLQADSSEAGHVLAGWRILEPFQGEIPKEDTLYLVMHSPISVEALFLPRPIEITTIEDLQRVGEDRLYPVYWDYVMMDDIDGSETASWDGGAGFRPIGDVYRPFEGNFDGQGHSISGLFINRPSEQQVGLFRIVGVEGSVANLTLVDASVTGKWAGVLAGANLGTISDCSTSGMVMGERLGGVVHANGAEEVDYFGLGYGSIQRCRSAVTVIGYPYASFCVGGFCGGNAGNISECSSTGAVYGVEFVGGFTGFCSYNGVMDACYATGPVTGYSVVGGFLGAGMGAWVNGCYSAGAVAGTNGAGGLIGWATDPYYYFWVNVTSSYWDWMSSGTDYSDGGEPRSTPEMMTAETFVGWDFTDVWGIDEGNSYPYLLWETERTEK